MCLSNNNGSEKPTANIQCSPPSHILPGNSGDSVHKLGFEEDIGIVEHAVLERDNDELGTVEMAPQHLTNILLETDTDTSSKYTIQVKSAHRHTQTWVCERSRAASTSSSM